MTLPVPGPTTLWPSGIRGRSTSGWTTRRLPTASPWLNPYAAETVQYIGDLIAEVHAAGFDQVLLENVQFPSSTSAKQDYGTTNGVDRAGS